MFTMFHILFNRNLISKVLWIMTSSCVLVMLCIATGSWVPLSHTLIHYIKHTDILSPYLVGLSVPNCNIIHTLKGNDYQSIL